MATEIKKSMEQKVPTMLIPREVSERTNIPVSSIRRWADEGKITHVRCGRKVLINYDRFLDFLNGDQ